MFQNMDNVCSTMSKHPNKLPSTQAFDARRMGRRGSLDSGASSSSSYYSNDSDSTRDLSTLKEHPPSDYKGPVTRSISHNKCLVELCGDDNRMGYSDDWIEKVDEKTVRVYPVAQFIVDSLRFIDDF